jgi:SAM-dependent methyltransferase
MKCYLCQSQTKLLFYKRGYNLYRCPKCKLVITDLHAEYEVFVRKFYQKGYFMGDKECGAYAQYEEDKQFIMRNMRHHLSVIQKLKPTGKLLDIGCAMGFFMEMANNAGYDVYGLDPSEYAINHVSKSLSCNLQVGTINTAQYQPEKFDVISMLDVFEHLADPISDLKKIYRWLKPDGILLIATGDTESITAKILGRHWTFFTPPQHVMCYHRQGISEVLGRSGFVPEAWYRIGKWLSLVYFFHLASTSADWRWAAYLHRLTAYLRIENVPIYLPMNDNITVIAKKGN